MNDYGAIMDASPSRDAEPASPYGALMDADVDQRKQALAGTLNQAVGTNPDQYSAKRKVAGYLGYPVAAVEANPKLEEQAKTQRVGEDSAASPALRQKYSEADFAKLAHDDSGALSAIAAGVKWLVGAPGAKSTMGGDIQAAYHAGQSGAAGALGGIARTAGAPFDFLDNTSLPGGNPLRRISEGFMAIADQQAAAQKAAAGESETWLGGAISGGVQSLAQNAPLMLAAFLPGGQAAALAGMGAVSGGQSYQKDIAKGIGHWTAFGHGLSDAVIEAGTEMLPLAGLVHDMKAGAPLFTSILRNAWNENKGEQVATALQDLNDWAVGNEGKTFGDYLAARPEAAAQTLIAVLVGAGGNVAIMHSVQGAADRMQGFDRLGQQTEAHAEHLQGLMATALDSKLRERDPQAFRDAVQAMAEDDPSRPQNIYVDAEVLNQLPPEVLQTLPGEVLGQLKDALASGDVVSIPVADALAMAPGTPLEQTLVEHGRIGDPMAPSQAEAKQAGAQAQAWLATESASVIQQAQDSAAMQASSDAVRQGVLDQLNAVGRFRPAVNEGYATWTAAFYTTMAGRLGMTPEAMAAKYPLRIVGETGQGAALAQGPAIKISGVEFGEAASAIPDLRKAAKDWYDSKLKNTSVVNEASGRQVKFAGARKAFHSSADPLKVKLFAALPELIRSGAIISSAKPANPQAEKDTRAYHWLVGEVAVGDQVHRVGVTLREDGNGNLYYNHNPVKEKAPESLGADPAHKAGGVPESDAFEQSVAPTAGGINLDVLGQGQARGTFNPANLELALNKNADLSTFLHETGHFFLEVMADLSGQENAPAEIKADFDTLLNWFGVTAEDWATMPLEQQRPYHERFAESIEQYLIEGNAPSVELQPVFRRMRAWMLNAYKSLKAFVDGRTGAPDIQLSDEVRGVFDRMLAAEGEIRQAEEMAGMMPDDEATASAMEKLAARSIRDLKWSINARGRAVKALQAEAKGLRDGIEAEVVAEVDAMPVYRAKDALARLQINPDYLAGLGEWKAKREQARVDALGELQAELLADHPDTKGLAKGQLLIKNKRSMENRAEAIALEWEAANAKPKKGDNINDMDLAVVADSFGFDDVDTMLQEIQAAGPKQAVIDGMTDQRMLEQHGDLVDQPSIEAAANQAVHNAARAKSLATELKAQSDALGARTDTGETNAKGSKITVNALMKAAEQFAAKVVAGTTLKDMKAKAWQHTAAERRAAKRWQDATTKGDTAAAIKAKQDQVLNNAAAKAAMDAMGEARTILEFFKKITKGTSETVVEKGRDPDIVNAARAVLAAYGVGNKGAKSAIEYLELVEKHDPALFATLQPSIQGALNMAQPLEALTMEQLQGLHEEMQAMWHLAQRTRQMEVAGNMMEIADAVDELAARMQTLGVPVVLPGQSGALTPREIAANKLQFAGSIMRRAEQWAEGMDGKWGGPFLRLVFQPVKDAADRYRTDRVVYRKAYQALVDAVAPDLRKGLIAAPELGYTFGRGHNGIGHAELLHAVLHTGNESNKRKLLLGRKWATENLDGTLDTSKWDAFLQRMHQSGTLNKAHYDFAQGVWDLLEKTKPLAQKTHRDVFGRYFAEVTADAFSTPFGDYRGGYVPAQADPRIVQDAALKKLIEEGKEGMAYAFPATNKGFTKGRVEYNRPLLLDLRTIGQHIDKVLLFAHMERHTRDVTKLLAQPGVSQSLGKIDPTIYAGMLTPWLHRSARQIVETPIVGDGGIGRVLSAARGRAGMALMLANVSNTIQQLTGFVSAFAKLKADGMHSTMMASTAQFISGPKAMAENVATLSPFMANRMANEIAAINDAMDAILLDPSLYEKAQAWTAKHAYFMQSAFDNTMGPIIWTSAYNAALTKGIAQDQAVRYADGVIRQTQGSTLPEDVSRIETGQAYARIFTQFIGWANMMLNTSATQVKQISTEIGLKKGAGKALMLVTLGMMAPIWVASAVAEAMRGGPDDPEGDGYLDDWLAAVFGLGTIKGMFAMVPFVGQVANAGINTWNKNPNDDRMSLSPVVSMLEGAVGAPLSVYKAIHDEGSKAKAVKDVATAVSIATGLPALAIARPLSYLAGVDQGKISPLGPVDAVRGTVTGTASPESRNK